MQWLAALCVKRPVFATVLILSLVVIGGYSFTKLGVDRFPKIDFPTVLITTVQPGAAPEQIETEITDKIEEAVNTISGIDELRSVSSEGISQVIIAFLLDGQFFFQYYFLFLQLALIVMPYHVKYEAGNQHYG